MERLGSRNPIADVLRMSTLNARGVAEAGLTAPQFIDGILDVGINGSIRVNNGDVTLDQDGISIANVAAYTARNSLKWHYSGVATQDIYANVDDPGGNTYLNMESRGWASGKYGAIRLLATCYGDSTRNIRLVMRSIASPDFSVVLGSSIYPAFKLANSGGTNGGLYWFNFETATGATIVSNSTRDAIVGMMYWILVKASGGGTAYLTGSVANNSSASHNVAGTNDFGVGINADGSVYWVRNSGDETYTLSGLLLFL